MHDIEVVLELCKVLVPLALIFAMPPVILLVTIVKAMRGDFDHVCIPDKKADASHVPENSERRSRPYVQYDAHRWLSAIRDTYRRGSFWARAHHTEEHNAKV